jgi:hypothetical protein
MAKLTGLLGAPFAYRCENIGDHFVAWFRAEVALAVDADNDGVGVHVAFSDHDYAVDFHSGNI